jgi:hypothetical protein
LIQHFKKKKNESREEQKKTTGSSTRPTNPASSTLAVPDEKEGNSEVVKYFEVASKTDEDKSE